MSDPKARFQVSPRHLCLALLLSLTAGFAGTVVAQNPKEKKGKPAPKKRAGARKVHKVGVVDIGKLFKKYDRKDKFEKNINQLRESLKKELEQDHKKLKQMRKEFENIPYRKGSEPWFREREKLKLAQYRWELKQERMQQGLKNEVEHNTLQILGELEATITDYGKKYGYDLILKIDKAGRNSVAGKGGELVEHFQERIFRAQISDVLYYDKDWLDITNNVLRHLNSPANKRKREREAELRKKEAAASRSKSKKSSPKKPK